MQSFPKNVHIGPLIGSKTDKGPGQKNIHQIAPHDCTHANSAVVTSTPSTKSNGSIPTSIIMPSTTPPLKHSIQCKSEKSGELGVVVKPEIIDSHQILHAYNSIETSRVHKDIDKIDKPYEKVVLTPQHHPNYTLNPKLLEQPEMSVSPARGSIGLPGIPPVQASAVQPLDVPTIPKLPNEEGSTSPSSINCISQTPTGNRRARVGKNMAREMITNLNGTDTDSPAFEKKISIFSSTPIKEQISNEEYDSDHLKIPHFLASHGINGKLIKKEDVKKECDDDVLIISDKSESETNSTHFDEATNAHTIDLSDDSNGKYQKPQSPESSMSSGSLKRRSHIDKSSEIIDLDEDSTITKVKRRKILEFNKNPSKKSPPNSYKSLIKPSGPKSYLKNDVLCKPPVTVNEIVNGQRKRFSLLNDPRCDRLADVHSIQDYSINNQNAFDSDTIIDVDMTDSINTIETSSESVIDVHDKLSTAMPSIADEFPQELTTEKESFMSKLDLTTDSIAKGYCSDNEVLSRKQERLKSKIKVSEARSRSESKKSEKTVEVTPKAKSKSSKTRERSTSSSKSRDRSTKTASKQTKQLKQANSAASKVTETKSTKTKSAPKAKKTKQLAKSTNGPQERSRSPHQDENRLLIEHRNNKDDDDDDENEDTDDEIDSLLANETHTNHNNNNNILIYNNNKMHLDALDAPAFNVKMPAVKKSKSRGSKFSNKKRHRARNVKHIEEVIIPRRTVTAPRWSNGWNWLGEPFQGKVFLNVSSFLQC